MLGKFAASVAFALGLTLIAGAPATAKDSKEEQRAAVRQTSQQILRQLYRVSPLAKKVVASAVGYAVFSNISVKPRVAGDGAASGMAVNNATQAETFMKAVAARAGPGPGAKRFRLVFVFETPAAFDGFINAGWESGGQGTAAASYGKRGGAYQGAVSLTPGVWIYQITRGGLAHEISGKGTRYYRDDELN